MAPNDRLVTDTEVLPRSNPPVVEVRPEELENKNGSLAGVEAKPRTLEAVRPSESESPLDDEQLVQEAIAQDPGFAELVQEINSHLKEVPGDAPSRYLSVQVLKGIFESKSIIISNFEQNPSQKNNLEFHNWNHTIGVIRRTLWILETVNGLAKDLQPPLLTKADFLKAALYASYHDTVQRWRETNVTSPQGLRLTRRDRFLEYNEADSAQLLIAHMYEANRRSSEDDIFSPEDFATAEDSLKATIPGFNGEIGTVVQPYLKHGEHSLISRALALADLGVAGIEGPSTYIPEGKALFREENRDITSVMTYNPRILEPDQEFLNRYDEATQETIRNRMTRARNGFMKRMVGWVSFQPIFASGRQRLFRGEVLSGSDGQPQIEPSEIEAIKNLLVEKGVAADQVDQAFSRFFNQFEATIEASNTAARVDRELADMGAFWHLASDLGYQVPDDLLAAEAARLPRAAELLRASSEQLITNPI